MGERTSETMNLDLNLCPVPEQESGSIPNEPVNLDDWIEEPIRIRDAAVRLRTRQRWRWRQVQIPQATENISVELNQLMVNSSNGGNTLRAGEGSVGAEERTNDELPKSCECNNGFLEEEESEKKDDDEKGSGSDGSFFDCNICFDLAKDPVVTCCGHLFCWACLYRWLHLHSDAKECPVCKGEVTIKNVTPIYGRGNNVIVREAEEDSTLKIPPRPFARRVESWRQTMQRNTFSFPVEEMLRRLGSRFDLTQDLTSHQVSDVARESAERTSSLLNRILTSRGMRREAREQNPVPPPDEIADLAQNETGSDARETNRLLIRSHFRSLLTGRNAERPPVDDRDSFSSIAAVINSESQTMDTAVEIDSMVSHSTSSSRRRNDASRASDVDSGDSRAPRRRRLN